MLDREKFEGISADYILLIAHYLALKPKILLYANRDNALKALSEGSVDMVLNESDTSGKGSEHFTKSAYFMFEHLALVSRKVTFSNTKKNKTALRLAVSQNSLDQNWLKNEFPNAKISQYLSVYDAMSSVAFANNDYFVGNLASVNYFIENNFNNILNVIFIYSKHMAGTHLLIRKNNPLLLKAVNSILKGIPITQRESIIRQWNQKSDTGYYKFASSLTEKEKEWIKQNRQQKVLVNLLYSPYYLF